MFSETSKQVTISIVSHGHCNLLSDLLKNLINISGHISHVIITHNKNSFFEIDRSLFPFKISFIKNSSPLGFSTNHNQAFRLCKTSYYCVLNPDVEFIKEPFEELIKLNKKFDIGISAPLVKNQKGELEDSFRFFPTPFSLIRKFFYGYKGIYKIKNQGELIEPDCIGGMFMFFRNETYKLLGGFDEKFFLYYEDTDICLRSWKIGKKVAVCPNISVIHRARRDSHTKLVFMKYHLQSMLRFFLKHWMRFPR